MNSILTGARYITTQKFIGMIVHTLRSMHGAIHVSMGHTHECHGWQPDHEMVFHASYMDGINISYSSCNNNQ